jgi:hypothetical protein
MTTQSDETRCAVCGWPLGDEPAQCRRGDCSFRPRPERLFDAARAAAEARRSFTPSAPPAEVETHECRGKVRNWPAVACSMCGVTPAEPQPREEMTEEEAFAEWFATEWAEDFPYETERQLQRAAFKAGAAWRAAKEAKA